MTTRPVPDHLPSSAFLPPAELPTGVLVWWVGVMAPNPDRFSVQSEYDRLRAELDSRFTRIDILTHVYDEWGPVAPL